MNVKELIKRLSEFDQELEVMVLDGFNGGGSKRDLNLGPTLGVIDENVWGKDFSSDCEDREGESVVVIGYGCY